MFDYYRIVIWATSLMSCWLLWQPIARLFTVIALWYFVYCMVTNKYD